MKTRPFTRSPLLPTFLAALLIVPSLLGPAGARAAAGTVTAWGDNAYGQTDVPPDLTNAIQLTAGDSHSMALRANGTVVVWGANDVGQTNVPSNLSNVVAIAAGGYHNLVLREDGSVVAWGGNTSGQTNVPLGLSNVTAVAAGGSHNLALKQNGTVAAWGYNLYRQTDVPPGLSNVTAVAAGAIHSLALKADGTVAAWGYNYFGQTNVPAGLTNVVAVSAGQRYSLALKANGTLISWGKGPSLPGLTAVVAVAAGALHSLALFTNGTVAGWGDDTYGKATVPAGLSNVVAIAAGANHSLALTMPGLAAALNTSNTMWTGRGEALWFAQTNFTHDGMAATQSGAVQDGQSSVLQTTLLGPGTLTFWWKVSSETNADFLSVRLGGSVQASLSGEVDWCQQCVYLGSGPQKLEWIYSKNGSLAAGQDSGWVDQVSFVPGMTAPSLLAQPFSQNIAPGWSVTLAAKAVGTPPLKYQWQFNGTNIPGATAATFTVTNMQFSSVGNYLVAVTNAVGGTITSNALLTLVQVFDLNYSTVPALTNVVALAAGDFQNLALKADGTVVAWQPGSATPIAAPADWTNVVAISSGVFHALALRADGTAVAWGGSSSGEGVVPAGLTNVVAIAAGHQHSLALKGDGTVVAWGLDYQGLMNVPPGLSGVVAVAAGSAGRPYGQWSLAVRADGTAAAWGAPGAGANTGNALAVAGNPYYGCLLNADGTVAAWRSSNPSVSTVITPAKTTNAVAVSSGYHCMALHADGTVKAWAVDYSFTRYYDIGVPSQWTNVSAVADGVSSLLLVGMGPPWLGTPFARRSSTPGGKVEFYALASGAWPMSYQWQFKGTNLLGATSPMLVLSGVQPANSGEYRLVVTNSLGSITSAVAALEVTLADIVWATGTTNLPWSVSGNGVWFGQTNTSHDGLAAVQSGAITNNRTCILQTTLAGPGTLTFWWRVSSQTNSDVLALKVGGLTQASISGEVDWQQQTIYLGPGSQTVQWVYSKDNTGSSGEDAGWLDEVNFTPGTTSPVLLSQPASQSQRTGLNVIFSVAAAGTPPLKYQWRFQGTNLLGATASLLNLTNIQPAQAGNYTVVVTNNYGIVTSAVAVLTLLDPTIAVEPVSQSKDLGQSVTFSVAPAGTPPFTYQWWKDGVALPGATAATLTRTNLTVADAGHYTVVLSNQYGCMLSAIALLTVNGATLDVSFNPVAGGVSYPEVLSLAVQADGKILVGGYFTTLGGQTRNRIGRLNADGSLDENFNPGATWSVYSLAVQADGKILVGGAFISLGGQTRNHLGRLNADGSLDNSFNPDADSNVQSLAVQADGKILVGGAFISLGGQTRNRIGRLNADGSLDENFNPGATSSVYSLAVQADGKILVGGESAASVRIRRLNNTEPATVSLSCDGATITWLRGGTSPEVWRTTFDACTNGMDWITFGAGARITGGWQQTGLSLPASATIRARGSCTGGYLNGSSWYVETTLGPVAISQQPASRTNNAGTIAQFVALGAGTPPYSYQWCEGGTLLSDGGNISGAQTATLRLTNVLGGDAGGYSVIISNSNGCVTSQVATLTVLDPFISAPPTGQTASASATAGFSVAATGTTPFGYQWRRNGLELAGATAASLTLTNVQWADAGSFDVVVTNCFGAVTSAVAVLRVNGPVIIVNDGHFGPGTNGFGFNVGCMPGQGVVIEASTNLVNWVAVQTNLVTSEGIFVFIDRDTGSFPRRFYRARLYIGALPAPGIDLGAGAAGFPANAFGFGLRGVAGQTVVIQASTNLVNWTPLATNLLGTDLLCFSDSACTNFPQRFYRAVLGP